MILAVGFFDGVHRGHRKIIEGATAALTFRNHPFTVLSPQRVPELIMTFDDKLKAIKELGVENVFALEFTPALASQSAADFAMSLPRIVGLGSGAELTVRCGDNWRFGHGGVGTPGYLRQFGIAVEVVSCAQNDGETISSTGIRRALSLGDIKSALVMLGHSLVVHGKIIAGKGLGRSIGYPTVNLELLNSKGLAYGVYACRVCGSLAIANYGFAPTAGDKAWKTPVMEVHFINGLPPYCEGSGEMTLDILDFVRHERAFASFEELTRQISFDIEKTRQIGGEGK